MRRSPEECSIDRAAKRVDYRLSYAKTEEPRGLRGHGMDGPNIPNSFYGRECEHSADDRRWGGGCIHDDEMSSGGWEDPDHPADTDPEQDHIDRWFMTAVREAVHEALEWYYVDGALYLNPHGEQEDTIHHLSEKFVEDLITLRQKGLDTKP